jgi:PTH1 family peptidyl-tRNA hydrolase|tara:strand:+ start:4618 stop:5238 length:621 start_codon:yes stop_codon:yes gene_type:complete
MIKFLKSLFYSTPEENYDPMKYLIVGLGNIGSDYAGTRHNIGFDVVNMMAKDADVSWKQETLGDVAELKHKGRTLVLLKPSTYMNKSGKALKYWMEKKKIPIDNVLAVVDELQLELGVIRLKPKGSDGGHNGLKDIAEVLGSTKYSRLRVGIGKDFRRGQQIDHVLGKWNAKEKDELIEIIPRACETAKSFAAVGLKFTMEKYNQK